MEALDTFLCPWLVKCTQASRQEEQRVCVYVCKYLSNLVSMWSAVSREKITQTTKIIIMFCKLYAWIFLNAEIFT